MNALQAFHPGTASFIVPAVVILGLLIVRHVEKRVGLRQ